MNDFSGRCALRLVARSMAIVALCALAACGGDGDASKGPGCWHGIANPLPPSGLHYARDTVVYELGRQVEPNAPTHGGGQVDSYVVDPPLPDGLSMDPVTGVVSGIPRVVAAPAVHAVTGNGPCGSTTTGLQIAVIAGALPPEKLTFENQDAIYTVGRPIPPNQPSVEGGVVTLYSATRRGLPRSAR
ncbi:MAG TPA: hypothetical protein VIP27_04655 [Variovorax sp.]